MIDKDKVVDAKFQILQKHINEMKKNIRTLTENSIQMQRKINDQANQIKSLKTEIRNIKNDTSIVRRRRH